MELLINKSLNQVREYVYSHNLKRKVTVDIVFPRNGTLNRKKWNVLFMNDGQDFEKLKMNLILEHFWASGGMHFLFVGIHCNSERLEEYGTAGQLDFVGRGKKAAHYQRFVRDELFELLQKRYPVKKKGHLICGFSMGGLSALDAGLNYPKFYAKVGVFSGAFWWRSRNIEPLYSDDRDRIMHAKLKTTKVDQGLSCWFQCGTEDEKSDRNKNGIIDSIDDTLDLIKILGEKGLKNLHYEEVRGGKHEIETWRKEMPKFLLWAFR